jgi:hypothetical protein
MEKHKERKCEKFIGWVNARTEGFTIIEASDANDNSRSSCIAICASLNKAGLLEYTVASGNSHARTFTKTLAWDSTKALDANYQRLKIKYKARLKRERKIKRAQKQASTQAQDTPVKVKVS